MNTAPRSRLLSTWNIVAALLFASVTLLWTERSFGVSCGAGDTCACTPAPAGNCIGGFPAACDPCRGLFQPCWDKYCDFASYRCDQNMNGVTNCRETLIAVVSGLRRSCVGGEIDWSTCWGQPVCVTEGVINVAGNRYTCNDTGS